MTKMRQLKKTEASVIEALLTNETVTRAAEQAGMSRQHVHRLLRDPDFAKALRRARAEAHNHAMSRLCHLSSKAVSVLESALDGTDIPKTQFLAARAVLDFSGQAIATDFEDRIQEIEQQLERQEVAE